MSQEKAPAALEASALNVRHLSVSSDDFGSKKSPVVTGLF
jgi:hypothetical protein